MYILQYRENYRPIRVDGLFQWVLHLITWPILAIASICGAVYQVPIDISDKDRYDIEQIKQEVSNVGH